MKAVILSSLALVLTVTLVICSSLFSSIALGKIEKMSEEATTEEDWSEVGKEMESVERFLYFTMNDSALTEIALGIREVHELVRTNRQDEAEVAKSRLCCLLERHRRLSGFNPSSIF